MGFLVGYDTALSSVTFYVNEDRFPCFDGRDAGFVPHPVVSDGMFNRNLYISSSKPGFVNVDWGDGIKEQYPLVKSGGEYKIIFRSLDIEWYKNPDSSVWWFLKEDGSQYIPVPPHKYDSVKRREVTMTFSGIVDRVFAMNGIVLHEFPLMNLPDISQLNLTRSVLKNGDIPFDRIGRSVNITNIQMGLFEHPGVWPNWPEGVLKMKKLTHFGCNSVFDFSNDPNSNWRRFSEWKNLTTFNWNWNNIPSYDPAFNDIPANTIEIISNRNDIPSFDEVDKVGDDKVEVDFLGSGDSWKQELVHGKLNKIQVTYINSANVPVDKLPDWFYEVREFRRFNFRDGNFARTQERADTFVDSFYEKVTSWRHITMSQTAADGKRNQFYGVRIDFHSAAAPGNKRPSGDYRAPEGFVKGVSNGNPKTPMEKVWALTNNYAQVWILPPAPSAKAAMTRAIRAGKARITPFVLGVKDGQVLVASGDVVADGMDIYDFADKHEGVDICDRLGLDSSPVVEYFRKIEEGEL